MSQVSQDQGCMNAPSAFDTKQLQQQILQHVKAVGVTASIGGEAFLQQIVEATMQALPGAGLKQMRLCVERGRPLGEDDWVRQTARILSLDSTLRDRGRPKMEDSRPLCISLKAANTISCVPLRNPRHLLVRLWAMLRDGTPWREPVIPAAG